MPHIRLLSVVVSHDDAAAHLVLGVAVAEAVDRRGSRTTPKEEHARDDRTDLVVDLEAQERSVIFSLGCLNSYEVANLLPYLPLSQGLGEALHSSAEHRALR